MVKTYPHTVARRAAWQMLSELLSDVKEQRKGGLTADGRELFVPAVQFRIKRIPSLARSQDSESEKVSKGEESDPDE